MNPRPSACQLFFCPWWRSVQSGRHVSGAQMSGGSENQHRQPDKALRLSAWLLGTDFSGLHTGDRTGAGPRSPLLHLPAGGAGAPHQQQSPGQAQGECQREETPHPGSPGSRSHPGPPLGSLLEPCSQRNLDPISPPTCPTAQSLLCPDAKSLSSYL